MRTCPRIFVEVAKLTRRNTVTTSQRLKTKRGFTPSCKGLGIYCNGFSRCGALGPHKCNLSDLSDSIKEVEIVKERISIHCISVHLCFAFCPAYLVGKRIGQGKENESALATLCVEAPKKERDCEKCIVGTL